MLEATPVVLKSRHRRSTSLPNADVEWIVTIKQVNFKNWASVSGQLDTNLNSDERALGRPTGAGKECLAQKRRDEIAEAVREISSEQRR